MCRSWTSLKKWLIPSRPVNLDAWRALPLWHPHVNQIDPSRSRCGNAAQKALRDCGFHCMADVTNMHGTVVPWEEALRRGARPELERAYISLIANLQRLPDLRPPHARLPIFLEGTNESGSTLVWKFSLPVAQLTEAWLPFLDHSLPDCTYLRLGQHLTPRRVCRPGNEVLLQ